MLEDSSVDRAGLCDAPCIDYSEASGTSLVATTCT